MASRQTAHLREGDIVGLDYGVIYEGFYGDSAMTVAVGKVSAAAQTADGRDRGIALRWNRAAP